MSEHEPIEPQETHITFNLGKHTFEFDPANDNPRVFKMGEEPHHNDYFVFVASWVNGEPQYGFVFFRELFEMHGIDMDDLIEFFTDEEVPIVKQDGPDDSDVNVYEVWANSNPRLPLRLVFREEEEQGGETAGTEQVPSKELVVVEPEPPTPLPEYGATKEAEIARDAGRMAFLLEHIANGGKYA